MVHDVRIIRMHAKHAPSDIRNWQGDSVGRWEGDTLVVKTTNFNDSRALSGASRNLNVVERISRIDADTLRYRFAVEDPPAWTEPWSGEYTWPSTESRVYEYDCHELFARRHSPGRADIGGRSARQFGRLAAAVHFERASPRLVRSEFRGAFGSAIYTGSCEIGLRGSTYSDQR